MKSLHQTRENIRMLEAALNDLADVDLYNHDLEHKFNHVFDDLQKMIKHLKSDLKEIEMGIVTKWE